MFNKPLISSKNLKTQLLYWLILSLLFSITMATFFSIKSLIRSSELVAHSQLLIGRGNELKGFIYKARHASRGFFVSGNKSYIERYELSKAEVIKFIADTKRIVKDNPAQVALLEEINNRVQQLFENAQKGIEHKSNLMAYSSAMQQHAIQQASLFSEIKAALTQLRLVMNQQKSYETEILVIDMLVILLNCEVLQKNFLFSFSDDEPHLEVYDTALNEFMKKIGLLEQHIAGDETLVQQVNTIKTLVEKSRDLLQKHNLNDYVSKNSNDHNYVNEITMKNDESMQSIEQSINTFAKVEETFSTVRNQNMHTIGLTAQSVSIFGNLMIVILGIVVVISLNRQDWLKSGHAELNEKMKGEQNIMVLTKNITSFIATYLKVKVGLFYLLKTPEQSDQKPYLQLISSYAYTPNEKIPDKFFIGEGLIGEVALERKPAFYSSDESMGIVQSTLLQFNPRYILFMPVLFENTLIGIFELGTTRHLKKIEYQFLEGITQNIGITLNTTLTRARIGELLSHSQKQEKELLLQKSELQRANHELQMQTEELRSQEEELRQYNEQLEQRTHELEEQREGVRQKNQLLEKAKIEVEVKAQELEIAGKYKSEFLANMSHELRTPLNSILMLAQILGKNNEGNLTAKQIEQTQTIYQSGNDLLNLINDVLDLSKVEAGKMDIHLEDVPLADLAENVKRRFLHMAEGKGLLFQTVIADGVPSTIHTDAQRLNQIVTNLLANAIKFTAKGTVQLVIERPLDQEALAEGFNADEPTLALRVIDSGIGIPKSKQQLIFEAFQQADGTTSRHYGGTGLGLSISREFSKLLGGKLGLLSEEGKGSTFTLYLPISYKFKNNQKNTKHVSAPLTISAEKKMTSAVPENNPNNLLAGKSILIVDDDQRNSFALTLILDNIGMTTLSCSNGREALLFLEKNPDTDVVLMNIMMTGIDGYETIRKIRKQPQFGKLPIIAITAKIMAGDRQKCIEAGASDYLTKPVNQEQLLSVLQVWLS